MVWNIAMLLVMVDMWLIFKKMGHKGWEGIIPFYNYFLLFKDIYGSGEKAFTLLIPFYNLYVFVKLWIDVAKEFHLETWFGAGLACVAPIFMTMLAFGDQVYQDGSKANHEEDILTRAIAAVKNAVKPKPAEAKQEQ